MNRRQNWTNGENMLLLKIIKQQQVLLLLKIIKQQQVLLLFSLE